MNEKRLNRVNRTDSKDGSASKSVFDSVLEELLSLTTKSQEADTKANFSLVLTELVGHREQVKILETELHVKAEMQKSHEVAMAGERQISALAQEKLLGKMMAQQKLLLQEQQESMFLQQQELFARLIDDKKKNRKETKRSVLYD